MKNNSEVILKIKELKKYFTNNGVINKAVNGVSFDVKKGEIVGLIGESGSGKTTVGRSLLRLYDNFNGFVTLDGKVISGKRLSNSRNKFLRKNIQMIFQDPHAALNGQKTIYSILKEPLVVNGVINEKLKDIMSDWENVKSSYIYTFSQKVKNLKIKNLKAINKYAKVFFPKWSDTFTDYEHNFEENDEDIFINFFNYLEEKQKMESTIIDNMYSNTEQLMDFYYQKQKDFRDNKITWDEKALVETKNEYKKVKKLLKYSNEQYNAYLNKKSYKKAIKELLNNRKDNQIANVNSFNNFIFEYKNEAKISWLTRMNSYDLEFYLYNFKKQHLNLAKLREIKKLKNKFKYLSMSEVQLLIKDIDNYAVDFYNKYLENLNYSKDFKKVVKSYIKDKFSYNPQKFLKLNDNDKNKHYDELIKYYYLINEANKVLYTKQKPAASLKDLKEAKEKINNSKYVYLEENKKYYSNIKNDMKKLDLEILEESLVYKRLKAMQSFTDKAFMEISKSFFNYLNTKLLSAKSDLESLQKELNSLEKNKVNDSKILNETRTKVYKAQVVVNEIKKNISIYKNKIDSKLNTLKSFTFEVKYLLKDVRTIYLLLGVNRTKNKFVNFIKNTAARFLIKNLLYKTTIYKSLEDVGLLKQFAYRYPHEFSGGQRQRIVIARALITEPKVIVADEPIASLDISIQAQVVNLLKDLCQKKNIGMVFIAHDLSMIEYIADRVEIMHLGKIVESGTTQAVYNKPTHPYTINLFKAIPKISNANEKFENISFELDYLKEQNYPNIPKEFKVEEDHFVYGTKDQIVKWTNAVGIKID
ncbi:phosphate ABC transporter ATP-binding protein [Mycoplasmopsis maculosa]|uniref:Phosphate ABC transporter ATP-binding protein n=1 Tax=Mycoplasmopsis maculosa TaxID=114885 RepID=A0A449B5H1_9BACT|nr:ATP-binding cassette domain-containing protein [Mycoplasmopsis maculosa]VEU75819.1 phosphate ABC transporter ATP-binding protein [Mycoplasmopsis maculosa]